MLDRCSDHCSTGAKRSQINFQRMEMPKFSGNMEEYPEFKRKWTTLVGEAMLAPAVEVERLKDTLNQDARRAVTAIHTLPSIWKKLHTRYGNKGMIAEGIKRGLKTIRPSGKNEHEKMVDLGDKVDELVGQLEELKHKAALKYDKEFQGIFIE